MFVLISYDISDNRRRKHIHKALKSFGQWVQYSVFECELSEKDYIRLRDRLEQLLHPREDNIRFYRMCRPCGESVERIGGVRPLDEQCVFIE